MLPWSLCRLWQPDRAANAAQDTRSYTTARGTISRSRHSAPRSCPKSLLNRETAANFISVRPGEGPQNGRMTRSSAPTGSQFPKLPSRELSPCTREKLGPDQANTDHQPLCRENRSAIKLPTSLDRHFLAVDETSGAG